MSGNIIDLSIWTFITPPLLHCGPVLVRTVGLDLELNSPAYRLNHFPWITYTVKFILNRSSHRIIRTALLIALRVVGSDKFAAGQSSFFNSNTVFCPQPPVHNAVTDNVYETCARSLSNSSVSDFQSVSGTAIARYVPSESSSDRQKDEPQEEPTIVIRSSQYSDIVALVGDFNARVRKLRLV